MSTLAKLIHLPRYARNIQRLRQVTAVVVRFGFGHVLVRARLDRYAGFFNRGMALAEPDERLAELQWEQRVRLAPCSHIPGPRWSRWI